jgi:2-amino-4-hydroxy-6-hydroxymethyldihydropteridine diphosphokinase
MIYISLGSNLGNRINNLWLAVNLLTKRCLRDVSCSIVLETEAILPEGVPVTWNKPFLNMIISGKTNLSPKELLQALKVIEGDVGRTHIYEKWAPRIIDLDILLYGGLQIDEPNLTIPHPELNNRNFLQHLLSLMGVDPWQWHSVKLHKALFLLCNPSIC